VVSRQTPKISVEPESDLLVAFVNTRDLDEETDAIGDPEALERWIPTSGAGVGAPPVDAAGHRRVLALRESLRALLRANNGGEVTDTELAPLREAAENARYQASLGPGGALRMAPEGGGLDAFEARLLLAIERVQALGGWTRLKACPAEDCQEAFVDTSRNRSRTWCSMEVCGNRSKTRRYRRRK
jgi:predicted RNA-binding Zn ribbon-like protein